MPTSPSSDSPVLTSGDEELMARGREFEGVSIGAGPSSAADVLVFVAENDDPASRGRDVSLDRRRPDGFRDSHSAVMVGRGEVTEMGFSRLKPTGASRLFGIGRRGGDRAVG